jgi:hypothetical protein
MTHWERWLAATIQSHNNTGSNDTIDTIKHTCKKLRFLPLTVCNVFLGSGPESGEGRAILVKVCFYPTLGASCACQCVSQVP